MVQPRYIAYFFCSLLLWAGLYAGLTLWVDPYGVSPLQVTWERFNKYKPRRLNIDRILKPFEVWRHEPRTVFLGTSRTHQSMDPAVLDATRFAPAYNASIPASSLPLNVSHLRQYVRSDERLRAVIVELFFYNFLQPGEPSASDEHDRGGFLRNTAALFLSRDALWDSIITVGYNARRNEPHFEIMPGGHYRYRPGHDPRGPFGAYAAGIWKYHDRRDGGFAFFEPAFAAVEEMTRVAKERQLELVFFLTPNHAYDDYYLEAVGGWDAVAEWLARVSKVATVYSFSQPNEWVYEPVSADMRFWYDPYHYSLEMGSAMQRTFSGEPVASAPRNFFMRMTPEAVPGHVAQRKAAILRWAAQHPDFVTKFREERATWEAQRRAARSPRR